MPTDADIEAAADALYQLDWPNGAVTPINRESAKAALCEKARITLEAAERVGNADCITITFSDGAQ
jgi:hypothetical protein